LRDFAAFFVELRKATILDLRRWRTGVDDIMRRVRGMEGWKMGGCREDVVTRFYKRWINKRWRRILLLKKSGGHFQKERMDVGYLVDNEVQFMT